MNDQREPVGGGGSPPDAPGSQTPGAGSGSGDDASRKRDNQLVAARPSSDGDGISPAEKFLLGMSAIEERLSRAERGDRRLGVTTLIVTTVTALAVALLGGYIALAVQHASSIQHDDEIFAALLNDLGSENRPARAGAVIGLSRFADESNELRSAQTRRILLTQLLIEEDSNVIQTAALAIPGLGGEILGEVAQANREARQRFLMLATRAIRPQMKPLAEYAGLPDGERRWGISQDAAKAFDAVFENAANELDTSFLTGDEKKALARTEGCPCSRLSGLAFRAQDLASGINGDFNIMESLMDDPGSPSARPGQPEIVSALRQLLVTSIVLNRAMKRNAATLSQSDLSDTALLALDGTGGSFRSADLRGAYIAGFADRADFSESNLAGARLTMLWAEKANFSFTLLEGADLPHDLLHTGGGSEVPGAGVDLTGADWWNSAVVATGSEWKPFLTRRVFDRIESDDTRLQPWDSDFVCPREEESYTQIYSFARESGPDEEVPATVTRISFCPSAEVLDKAYTELEHAFPRKANEEARRQWQDGRCQFVPWCKVTLIPPPEPIDSRWP